jgi:hypothetical protein
VGFRPARARFTLLGMTSTPRPHGSADAEPITASCPADLLAAVPYLLGFHPENSVVVTALRRQQMIFAARADLPPPDAAREVAGYLAAVVARQQCGRAMVIGYGDATAVDPVLPEVVAALDRVGMAVLETLRAYDGRFWSYGCREPGCCPAEGTPYDPAVSPVAAAATYAGHLVLPDRAALAGRVAPLDGPARAAMRRAARAAAHRLVRLLDEAPSADVLGGRTVRQAGERALAELATLGRAGRRPTDEHVAWLALLLTHVPVRDLACRRLTGEAYELTIWSDVVRRVDPELVPAPAALLAMAAWRAGQGALANVALERALGERPDYPLARLLREALDRGLPPEALSWGVPSGPGHPGAESRTHGHRAARVRRRRRGVDR